MVNERKRKNILPAVIITLIVMALIFVFIATTTLFKKSDDTGETAGNSVEVPSSTQEQSSQESSTDTSLEQQVSEPVIDKNQWNLKLVNKSNPLPESFSPDLSYIDEEYMVAGFPRARFDSRAIDQLISLMDAAKADGINILVRTGYRTYSHQSNLYNSKIAEFKNKGYPDSDAVVEAAMVVAPPGTSEHNLGLAVDFNSLSESFENTKEFRWLSEYAADYGFILRYPKDKQDITGYIYEPWHYRYVGVEHARAIKEQGLCLEEYLNQQ